MFSIDSCYIDENIFEISSMRIYFSHGAQIYTHTHARVRAVNTVTTRARLSLHPYLGNFDISIEQHSNAMSDRISVSITKIEGEIERDGERERERIESIYHEKCSRVARINLN